jgi:hypothetical protein
VTAAGYPAEAYAVKRGVGRCIGFTLLSFGAWAFYYLHTYRRLLDAELADGRDDALLHTLGYLVPVWNVFILYWLWRDLDELRRRVGLPAFPVGGYVAGAIFLAPVFFSLAAERMNEYWDARLGGWAADAPVTTAEKVLLGLGAGIWALWVLTILLLVLLFALSGEGGGA